MKLFKLTKREELLNKSDFDFFDEEHAKPAFDDEQKIIKTGKAIFDLVEKEVQKDGSVGYVNTSKMPLRDRNNKIVGTFGILQEKKMAIKITEPINWSEREKTLRDQIESWLKDSRQPKLKDIVDLIIIAEKKMVDDD